MVGDDRAGRQAQRARALDQPGAAGEHDVDAARGPAAAGWIRAQSGVNEPPIDAVGADVLGDPVGVEQVRLVAPPGVGRDVGGDALELRAVAGER